MSQQQPEDNLINSDRSIEQLAWAIENSVGQFKLILARCNYSKLRDRLITRLQEICTVEIQVLVVQQSNRTLFTAIQETFGENISGCVMVVGLEAVQDLSQMLTSANQVREEFRKHFNFPLVVWIDDVIYQQFIQVAPDLESWAITKSFEINQQELIDFIIATAHQWFNNQLNLNFYEYRKLETELTAAQKELIGEENPSPKTRSGFSLEYLSPTRREAFPVPPSLVGKGVRGLGQSSELNAYIESLLGLTKQINNKKDAAIQHYHTALTLWQQSNNLEWQVKILGEKTFCAYLEAIKQQDKQHPAWQATQQYIDEYIQLSTQINRPDIIANSLGKIGDVLQELNLWQQLKIFVQQALSIHQTNNKLREIARDYGFLAEVALAASHWQQAIDFVKQALDIIPIIPQQSLDNRLVKSVQTYDLNLYKFILSRAQYHLGNTQEAISTLEIAKDGANPQEDVRLYIKILNQLHKFYFEQKAYLKAYNIKQQRRSIEQQFGLRAFVGAGRLEARRQTFVETLHTTSNISPEISASGRQLDIERLIERLNNDDYKLIVIHGQSGVGKSSLVNAGLVPALQQQSIRGKDNLVIVMRVYTNWAEELGRLLGLGTGDWGLGTGDWGLGTGDWGLGTGNVDVSSSEAQGSSSEVQVSSSEAHASTSEAQVSSSEVHSSALEPEDSRFEHQIPSSEPERSHLEPEHSHLEPEHFHLEPEHSHLEPEHSHLEPERSHSNLNSSPAPPASPAPLLSSSPAPLLPCSSAPLLLNSLLDALREKEQRNLRMVLVFDQFEEFFFVYTEPGQRKRFFEFLGSCLEVLSAKVILSLRVDYIHYLLECNYLPSFQIIGNDILSHRVLYKLGNFSLQDAKSIIQRLTANTSFQLEPDLVDALVEDLAGELGEVRPIELQVVGAQLQAENITNLEKYRQFGTKQDLVQHYLDEVIHDCGEEHQQLAEFVLFLLTDEQGTRPLKTRVELERDLQQYFSFSDVEFGEIPPTTLKKGGKRIKVPLFKGDLGGSNDLRTNSLDLVLEIVVKSGLVVLLPENPADRYQLVHDYLANFIRQQQEPKLKQVMAELEKEREQRKISEAKLNKFLKRALFGSVAAGIVMAIVTTVAVRSAYEADRQKENAEVNEINALNNSSNAFLLSNQHPDALLEALRAGDKLKSRTWTQEVSKTKTQTKATLYQAVYLKPGEKKQNRSFEVNTLKGHSGEVISVAYSPDGKYLASVSDDNTIKIWESSTGKAVQTLQGHSSAVYSVAYSPDGKYLASASDDNTIKIWESSTGKVVQTLQGHSSAVYSVAYSPDGKYLASASSDNTIKIWESSTGKAVQTLQGHSSAVYSVAYSPDGKYLASASSDNTIKIWESSTGKAVQTLQGHRSVVYSVAYSPDSKYLASASWDNTIKIWDLSTGKVVQTLQGHSDSVYSVAYSPDGKYLASASSDNTIKIWDISTGKAVQTFQGHSRDVNSVAYSPDGKHLASASLDNTIKIWDISTGKTVQTLQGHSSAVMSVAYSPDGKHLASASADNTIKIWDISTGKVVQTLQGHSRVVYSVAYSPDSKYLASASGDNTIKIWDISTGKTVQTLQGHSSVVISVAYSPDGKYLASASSDNTIKIWDISTGKAVQTLQGHSRGVYSVAYSPDSKYLASASSDNTIKIWDLSTDKAVQTLQGHSSEVISVAYSPDGKYLASASWDNTIKIWDISTSKAVQTLQDHSSLVMSVAYSPDGKYLAAASRNSTIKIWDISTGKAVQTLQGHSREVMSVAYSPNGKYLASASSDNTIKIWDLDVDNLLRSGCDLLNNYLIFHPEVLEELSSCQTPARLVPAATVLVIQGEKLARVGDISGAVAKFRQAQQWDQSLKFDPEAKAQALANK